MITFAEELLLLALNDQKGTFIEMPTMSLEYGLVGAILMELALKNKIDTDTKHLFLVDGSPTGDAVFDKVLDLIKQEPDNKKALFWVKKIANELTNLQAVLLDRLISKKILTKKKHKILWVFCKRCYPVIDNKEEKEVKTRIRDLVLNQEIPAPRDVVLISLIDSCNLTKELFDKSELEEAEPRMKMIAKMDLIGQAVAKALVEIQKVITDAIASVSLRPTP